MKSWSEHGHEVIVPASAALAECHGDRAAAVDAAAPAATGVAGAARAVARRSRSASTASRSRRWCSGSSGCSRSPRCSRSIFGHIALAQIKTAKGWQRGTGMALAGVILGWAFLAIFVIAFVFEPATPVSVSSTVVEYRLDEWAPDDRTALAALLHGAAVPSRWEDTSLLVPGRLPRATVDRSIAVLEPPPVSVERSAEPGWYVDPLGQQSWRWWDGHRWLAERRGRARCGPARGCRQATDHDHAVRGGVLAFVGWIVAIALGYGLATLAIALGADEDSLLVLCIGQAGLWAGMFGTCVHRGAPEPDRVARARSHAAARDATGAPAALTAFVARVACTVVALVLRADLPAGFVPQDHERADPRHRAERHRGDRAGADRVRRGAVLRGVVLPRCRPGRARRAAGVPASPSSRRRSRSRSVHYRIGMTLALTLATWGQIAVAGFFLGVLEWRYERLGPGMIAHGLFNVLAIAVLLANWL